MSIKAFLKPIPQDPTPVPAPPVPTPKHDEEKKEKKQTFVSDLLCKMNGTQRVVFGELDRKMPTQVAVFPLIHLPTSFVRWCTENDYNGFNSVEVAVHCRASKASQVWIPCNGCLKNDVIILCLADDSLQMQIGTLIGTMEFKYKKQSTSEIKVKKQPLYHDHVVAFSSLQHHKLRCSHRINHGNTKFLSITMKTIHKNKK